MRRHGGRLRREADALLTRLRLGESDVADELTWLARPLRRRGGRFNAEAWRALALRQLLVGEEVAAPGVVEGAAGERWLFAFFVIPPDANTDEVEALAGRALEAWLYLSDED